MNRTLVIALAGALLTCRATTGDARVVRLVVERSSPFAGGKTFGSVGQLEKLEGTVYFAVNPQDPLNAVIVNISKAPRNALGLVEFSASFVIVKPVDMQRGNHKVLYGINNRGNNYEIHAHSFPIIGTAPSLEDGDGLLFRLGYTFVDAGWAGDTTPGRRGAILPVAVESDGTPVIAPVRIEYTGEGYTFPLKGNAQFRSYETANMASARSTLTVRKSVGGPRTEIPSSEWAFGRCESGRASLKPTPLDLCLFGGFQPHLIYELIYPATNPWVMGLGYVVTRDLASFLRYETRDDDGHVNPIADSPATVGIRRAYGTGTSSTGMYLREYLYLGFNEDEKHRRVFDAVRIAIPGTHRLFANVEFADPNIYSRQDANQDFVSYSYPPLTYAVTTDPISGIRDGILKRPLTDPLVLQVDTANEFWQMGASLNVHDGRGQAVPVPDNVRLYFLSNHSHGGASGVGAVPTAKANCEYPVNDNRGTRNAVLRALLVALDEWADRGIPPPRSRYPDVRDGTLGTIEQAAKAFPAIPGLKFPTMLNEVTLLDYGPAFGPAGGMLAKLPPGRGPRYQTLVPMPDSRGVDKGGIQTVDISVPVGSNTGWNLIAAGPRGADLCGLAGSFTPFAKTRGERLIRQDTRLSLEERYKDHRGFVEAVTQAAAALVRERFLLDADARTIIEMAAASGVLRN